MSSLSLKAKALLTGSLLLLSQSAALAVDGTRGGGDDVALDFNRSTSIAISALLSTHPELNKTLSALNVPDMNMKVVVVDDPLNIKVESALQTSVAINSPAQDLIMINRLRWAAVNDDNLKQAISLHERLSLKGVESSGRYPISSLILSDKENTPVGVHSLQKLSATARLNQLLQNAPEPAPTGKPNFTSLSLLFNSGTPASKEALAGNWMLIAVGTTMACRNFNMSDSYQPSGIKIGGRIMGLSFEEKTVVDQFSGNPSDVFTVRLLNIASTTPHDQGPYVVDPFEPQFAQYGYNTNTAAVRTDAYLSDSCRLVKDEPRKLVCVGQVHMSGSALNIPGATDCARSGPGIAFGYVKQ
jgi:hypothetical protein